RGGSLPAAGDGAAIRRGEAGGERRSRRNPGAAPEVLPGTGRGGRCPERGSRAVVVDRSADGRLRQPANRAGLVRGGVVRRGRRNDRLASPVGAAPGRGPDLVLLRYWQPV